MNFFLTVSSKLLALILVVGFLLRIVLMIVTPESLGIGFGGCTAVLGLGLVNDLMVGILSLVFIWAYLMTIGNRKYRRIPGAVILTLLAAAFIYVSCFNTIFDEYGSVVPMIARGIFGSTDAVNPGNRSASIFPE